MYQRHAAGRVELSSSDPLDEMAAATRHPGGTSRQNSQNGHPFAVPAEKSKRDRDVGGRGGPPSR